MSFIAQNRNLHYIIAGKFEITTLCSLNMRKACKRYYEITVHMLCIMNTTI